MYRLIVLMGLLGWAALLQAQGRPVGPQEGMRITKLRVSLLGVLPASCVALESERGRATIVLPRKTLDRLAKRDEDAVEDTISRREFLASGRARELLSLLGPGRDQFGCQRLQGKPSMETSYLVGWMLEQGHAAVVTRRLGKPEPEPAIIVQHTDTLIFGYEDFLLLDGTKIWGYSVWVA
jgi:hypothetical protein